MTTLKRSTLYLDVQLHRALRLKAVETDRSLSDLVNDALRRAFTEDGDDLTALADRVSEPSRPFEAFVKDLRRRGRL